MLPTGWEFATLLCKLLLYGGTAMAAGALLLLSSHDDGSRRTLFSLLLYLLVAAILAFHAALAYFLIQIGLINGRGLVGMFDWSMASIMLDTPLGDTTFWRLIGSTTLMLSAAFGLWKLGSLRRPPTRRLRRVLQALLGTGLMLLILSYRFAGHVSVLAPLAQLALLLHVLVFAAWIGELPALLAWLRHGELNTMYVTLTRFGNQALLLVGVLALAGVVMLLHLLQSPGELLSTVYGRALLLKFALVAAILALAALNRFILVPALGRSQGGLAMRRALYAEIAVASLILAVTAYLSTLVGPMQS